MFHQQPLLRSGNSYESAPVWIIGLFTVAASLCLVATNANHALFQQTVQTNSRTRVVQPSVASRNLRLRMAESSTAGDYRLSRVITQVSPSQNLYSGLQGAQTFGWFSAMAIPLGAVCAAIAWKVLGNKDVMAAIPLISEKDMKVWNPVDNKKFETFSYLPPLSDTQIARQVDMIINKGYAPCLEFAEPDFSFMANDNCVRFNGTSAGYYDNRYWTMWKLPMFGCTDPSQVLQEIGECRRSYPQCYVRLAAFDSVKQVQVISFLVQRPAARGGGWAMAATSGEKDMKVWNPVDNKKFETFSYLPPLTDTQIARQVDMIINKGFAPCLEFAEPDYSFMANDNCVRFNGTSAGYYDNRYWTMWKLPMFGCTDPSQVLQEIGECRRSYPQCYVRLAAFDSVKQVQVISFLVQRPAARGGASGGSPSSFW